MCGVWRTISSEPEKKPVSPDIIKLVTDNLQNIAKLYTQWGWLIKMAGLKVPPDVDMAIRSIAEGKPITPEQVEQLKALGEKPMIGEPVLTRRLAEEAWSLHYGQGMATRDIAELFTKDGNPCSHSTVARWINMIDMEKQMSKALKLRAIAKYIIIGIAWIISLLLVRWYL